jgi:hypothetical protein
VVWESCPVRFIPSHIILLTLVYLKDVRNKRLSANAWILYIDAMKEVIQNLYDLQSQVHGYQHETHGPLVEKMWVSPFHLNISGTSSLIPLTPHDYFFVINPSHFPFLDHFRTQARHYIKLTNHRVDLAGSLSLVNTLTDPTHPNSVAHSLPSVPPELVDYVDEGRNPDIYTREIVELVQRGNAVVGGKMEAFKGFSEIFARKLKAMDAQREASDAQGDGGIDMEREVDRIMRNAGLETKHDDDRRTRNGDAHV